MELFTNGIGGTGPSSTTPVDLPAEDLWLPDDATVKLTMTVDGVTTVYTASARYGNFHFDIPAVPTGSSVSVRMDVYDSSGDLMLTGKASKTVSGVTDTLSLNLSTMILIPLIPPAGVDAWVWLYNNDPSNPMGWYSCPGSYPEYPSNISCIGQTVLIGGLAVKNGVVYEIPTQSITIGDVDSVALTMNTTKNFPGCTKLVKSTGGVGAAYEYIGCETDSSKKPALFDRADDPSVFEVSPCAPPGASDPRAAFQVRSLGASWGSAYTWPVDGDSWIAKMNGVISPGFEMKMHYEIKIDGSVVGSGDIINTAE